MVRYSRCYLCPDCSVTGCYFSPDDLSSYQDRNQPCSTSLIYFDQCTLFWPAGIIYLGRIFSKLDGTWFGSAARNNHHCIRLLLCSRHKYAPASLFTPANWMHIVWAASYIELAIFQPFFRTMDDPSYACDYCCGCWNCHQNSERKFKSFKWYFFFIFEWPDNQVLAVLKYH